MIDINVVINKSQFSESQLADFLAGNNVIFSTKAMRAEKRKANKCPVLPDSTTITCSFNEIKSMVGSYRLKYADKKNGRPNMRTLYTTLFLELFSLPHISTGVRPNAIKMVDLTDSDMSMIRYYGRNSLLPAGINYTIYYNERCAVFMPLPTFKSRLA